MTHQCVMARGLTPNISTIELKSYIIQDRLGNPGYRQGNTQLFRCSYKKQARGKEYDAVTTTHTLPPNNSNQFKTQQPTNKGHKGKQMGNKDRPEIL